MARGGKAAALQTPSIARAAATASGTRAPVTRVTELRCSQVVITEGAEASSAVTRDICLRGEQVKGAAASRVIYAVFSNSAFLDVRYMLGPSECLSTTSNKLTSVFGVSS
ncbi:hypothetical protein NDU88_002915 [Pleurodeles waltl]|uniref:Uncharacterized protein n=1 Tax=Pleurodeles waltl TaxID=8319 RepID=A0AAV7SD22_PLEWA|nr:hypothetical protein NDU88_002915 [Pleurodeles waltl]